MKGVFPWIRVAPLTLVDPPDCAKPAEELTFTPLPNDPTERLFAERAPPGETRSVPEILELPPV